MHRNNFDLLRLVLALAVLRSHAYLFGDADAAIDPPWYGRFAVECFFVISGYLIFQSWERSSSLGRYASKRMRRIVPAYAFVVLACAVGGAWLTTLSLGEYFLSATWLRYVAANLAFLNLLQPTLPGVFADNASQLVNGPLWSIKVEVAFYCAVPLIFWLGRRFRPFWALTVLYGTSIAWTLGCHYAYDATGREVMLKLANQLPGQLSFFVAGGALYHLRDRAAPLWRFLLPPAVAVLIGQFYVAELYPLYPAALGICVIGAAVAAPYLGAFGRYGDFSYGIYIYHYPILQAIVASQAFADRPRLGFALGAALTLLASALSWRLLEKPFLPASSHYRLAAETSDLPPATEPAAAHD